MKSNMHQKAHNYSLLNMRAMIYMVLLLFAVALLPVKAGPVIPSNSYADCVWVWYGKDDPATNAAPATLCFRSQIQLPQSQEIQSAGFLAAVDNECVVYINGVEAGRVSGWSSQPPIDVKSHLHSGVNTLAIVAVNTGPAHNPAGLTGKLVVYLKNSKRLMCRIDKSWRVSDKDIAGWEKSNIDDSRWPHALDFGEVGIAPWGWIGPTSGMSTRMESFPRFVVPGEEKAMDRIRSMYILHYLGNGPYPTMWDAWLPAPTLWPGVAVGDDLNSMPERWARALSGRKMEADGYVYTHQHFSHAYDHGWTFPLWTQLPVNGPSGTFMLNPDGQTVGWHFQDDGPGWVWQYHYIQKDTKYAGNVAASTFELSNVRSEGIKGNKWQLVATGKSPAITSPSGMEFDSNNSPFLQIRWNRTPAPAPSAKCYVEWMREGDTDFSEERRVYFSPLSVDGVDPTSGTQHCMIKMYTHPLWKGQIKTLRFSLAPGEASVSIAIDSIFTVFDLRQSVNNASFILGSCEYFRWSGDVPFLKENMGKMRKALLYCLKQLGGERYHHIKVPYIGHDGRSGFTNNADGTKTFHYGHGLSSNYWDMLPFGNDDMYATNQYYGAIRAMAELERVVENQPGWNIPQTTKPFKPEYLIQQAKEVKGEVNKLFWNNQSGRFVACIDADGVPHDYGYTFVNLESIYYDLATVEHSRSILDWIDGKRIVKGDTSTGDDIYHWRFAPRCSTKRNLDWYQFVFFNPENTPWGYSNQDGGAVLGFSFHDLMARLRTLGADNAWQRLKQITDWYGEVQAAGGYREYYKDGTRGSLQGGGPAGGLGMDKEFVESILLPHFLLEGFMGFKPKSDGFEIKPQLPTSWPKFEITRVHYRKSVLDITATRSSVVLHNTGDTVGPLKAYLPAAKWQIVTISAAGKVIHTNTMTVSTRNPSVSVSLAKGSTLHFIRK